MEWEEMGLDTRPSVGLVCLPQITGSHYGFLVGEVGEPVASYRSRPQQFISMPEPLLTGRQKTVFPGSAPVCPVMVEPVASHNGHW